MVTDRPTFAVGDVIVPDFRPERPINVTPLMYDAVLRLREVLIKAAKRRDTITYVEASEATNSTYIPQNLGKPLDLLSEDCIQRDEPSLAALVVRKDSGQVGSAFVGDAEAERMRCIRRPLASELDAKPTQPALCT